MNIKLIYIFIASLMFSDCTLTGVTEVIKGGAVIVDNFKDKNPLEGIYIEVKYTKDEGYNYDFVEGCITDKNGYFEINKKFKGSFMNIDSWAVANVYSDADYSDTLGFFGFQFAEKTYSYKTIHLDTFSLPHNIWVIPRIHNLGDNKPDRISILFYNCELVDTSQTYMTFAEPIHVNQTFTPVEIKMTIGIQHWLSFGTRNLASGSLKKGSQNIGFGYFTLEESKRTIEGDTLYLDFDILEDK